MIQELQSLDFNDFDNFSNYFDPGSALSVVFFFVVVFPDLLCTSLTDSEKQLQVFIIFWCICSHGMACHSQNAIRENFSEETVDTLSKTQADQSKSLEIGKRLVDTEKWRSGNGIVTALCGERNHATKSIFEVEKNEDAAENIFSDVQGVVSFFHSKRDKRFPTNSLKSDEWTPLE